MQGALLGLLEQLRIGGAGIGFARLLLLGLEDVGGALVARQQVGPVIGLKERAEGFDPLDDQDKVILAQRENRIDEVMAGARIAQVLLEAVGKEGEEFENTLIPDCVVLSSHQVFQDARHANKAVVYFDLKF